MKADDHKQFGSTMIIAPSAEPAGSSAAPRARLVCSNPAVLGSPAGQEILLDGAEVTIGRSPDHDVSPKADGISRNHARIFPDDGAWWVADLGSTNGVIVNGSREQRARLQDGDTIILGTVQYAFERVEEEPVPSAESDAMREAERTVVMRPTVKSQMKAPSPATAQPRRARTQATAGSAGLAQRSRSGGGRVAREQPQAGSGLKLIVLLAVVVGAAVAFVLFS